MPPSRLALSTFILLIVNVTAALGATVVDLPISNADIAPDGFMKSASLASGNTNFADGVPGVTQCPIVPNEAFSYKFNAEQAGTFMYHGYSFESPNDGTAGPLIIYDPDDPHSQLYDIDDENTVITLTDNYHTSTKALMTTYLSAEGNGRAPQPDSGLINGNGRYSGGPSVPWSVTNVLRARRYRLRLVNTGISTPFFFSIDGHQLTVIEVDGVNVQPVNIDKLRIDVGQRYSVVLFTGQPINNYWMRAEMDTTCFSDSSKVDPLVLGILRYYGARGTNPQVDPKTPVSAKLPLDQAALHPLEPVAVPGKRQAGGTDFRAVLDLAYDDATFRWTVNGKSWKPDANATLLQVLNGQTTFPDRTVIELPAAGKSVELEVNNKFACPQPIHLNGHVFHVVSDDGVRFNYENPVIRDTVTVGANSKVVLRFVAGNPGVWSLHSQNQWHRSAGLLTQLMSPPTEITQNIHPSPEWQSLCPAFDSFRGSAA
ncbi:laccase [Actinomortierella ambigua]|nr:laccase [Actinomortierella ambigua]